MMGRRCGGDGNVQPGMGDAVLGGTRSRGSRRTLRRTVGRPSCPRSKSDSPFQAPQTCTACLRNTLGGRRPMDPNPPIKLQTERERRYLQTLHTRGRSTA